MSAIQEEEYTQSKVQWSTWKRLLSYTRPHRRAVMMTLLAMAVVAMADVVGPYLNGYAIDTFITPGRWDGLGWYAAIYLVLIVFSSVCVFTFIQNAGYVEANICHDIRRDCFHRLQELSISYYDRTPVGYIMARMTSDSSRLADTVAWSLVDLCWGSGFMVISLASMFVFNWRLALVMLAILPPLTALSLIFQKRILTHQRNVRKLGSRITGAFNEGIMGARTTKTLVREDGNFGEFTRLSGSMRESAIRAAHYSALFMPIVMTLGSLATGAVLWLGGWQVQVMGLSLGELSFFLSLSNMFFEPVRHIAMIFAELQNSQAAAERVIGLLENQPEISDTPEVLKRFGDSFEPKRENWPPLTGEVTFENVSFQYKQGEKVLEDFSLHVPAGQTIALVGETGSGKTTIVNLLCRFYEPTAGRILIDGVDYQERSQLWLHSNLGYVLQSPHLFSGTIRDNIRYGKLDATDEEIEQAARLVGADGFISRLEKGYDTPVGEGGSRLSTGEKQLISFARAIVAAPALFVLDEATSSIDTETEMRIQAAIEKVLEGRTSFIIAHRLSTIRNADRILVIEKGRVIESGTHRELLAARGHYYQLYTNQFVEEKGRALLAGRAAAGQSS